jgi:hypothetical protein
MLYLTISVLATTQIDGHTRAIRQAERVIQMLVEVVNASNVMIEQGNEGRY